MSDMFDHAQAHEQFLRERAIADQAARMPRGESATHCQDRDCGIEIPEERRRAIPGVQYCIDCQERRERKSGVRPGAVARLRVRPAEPTPAADPAPRNAHDNGSEAAR